MVPPPVPVLGGCKRAGPGVEPHPVCKKANAENGKQGTKSGSSRVSVSTHHWTLHQLHFKVDSELYFFDNSYIHVSHVSRSDCG